jgi:hypothetical protein
MSKAFIQKPAPNFEGVSVCEGEFVDTKLSDYLGKWYVLPAATVLAISPLFSVASSGRVRSQDSMLTCQCSSCCLLL